MNRPSTRALLVGIVAALAGISCQSRVTGTLLVNGQPFQATRCQSGQRFYFHGIELGRSDGSRIRVIGTPGGPAVVNYFPPASSVISLGPCGTMNIEDQNSTVNDVRNVRGNVTFQCMGFASITGSIQFENCH